MEKLIERLRAWAQNEEMVNGGYTQHGHDCLNAIAGLKLLGSLAADTDAMRNTKEGEHWFGGFEKSKVDFGDSYSVIIEWPNLSILAQEVEKYFTTIES